MDNNANPGVPARRKINKLSMTIGRIVTRCLRKAYASNEMRHANPSRL